MGVMERPKLPSGLTLRAQNSGWHSRQRRRGENPFRGMSALEEDADGLVMESGSPGPCPGHGPDARPLWFQGIRGNMGSQVYKALCLGRCVAAAYASSLMEWTA